MNHSFSWLLRATAVVLLAFSTLPAQGSRNITLLANFAPGPRASGCWGYVDPSTGKEYAALGTMSGTYILDCSDPANPIQRALIPTDNPGSSNNRWQEIKGYGQYIYVVSEAYGGMQIIDMSNPDMPTKVTTWGTTLWGNAHNIAIDFDQGVAYVCGTNSGMHVIDIETNPTNPTRLAVVTGRYIHDLMVQDGLAHCAEINTNRYTVYDVTNPSVPSFLNSITSAGRSACHSMWPSRENDLLVVCHETSGGEMATYDISDPRLPVLRSMYQTGGSSAISHNPILLDRVSHVAWNTEGYQALDLSDPANPVLIGFYDTWSGSSSGSNGLWGIYPLQPSGVVYGSDRTGGLFLWKPKFTLVHYGAASPGTFTPKLHTYGAAWIGNSRFRLEVAQAAPSSSGLLVVASASASVNVSGLQLLVDLSQPFAALPISTDANGAAAVPAPLPNDPGLVGAQLYLQGFVLDATGPVGVSASRGALVELFQP